MCLLRRKKKVIKFCLSFKLLKINVCFNSTFGFYFVINILLIYKLKFFKVLGFHVKWTLCVYLKLFAFESTFIIIFQPPIDYSIFSDKNYTPEQISRVNDKLLHITGCESLHNIYIYHSLF